MKTQCKKADLLALLQKQWVSPIEALTHCGIFSLAQRCSEWRAAGIEIADKWVESPSGARFKAYRIGGQS